MAAINIFDNPQLYRGSILDQRTLMNIHDSLCAGKSLICVFFTSYCGVGCPFCFFSSPNPTKSGGIESKFSPEGVNKFINFANNANV